MACNYYSYVWQIGKEAAEMQPARREKEKKREREKEREQALLICVSAPRFLHLRGGNSGLSKL